MTAYEYTPSAEEVQELIVGLLLDAGDYVRHGQPGPGEVLTWDQREVRAWRAARLLSERHAHDACVRRDAWQEGYDQGAEDGITSEQMQVGIGLGGIARPARTNPYEETK